MKQQKKRISDISILKIRTKIPVKPLRNNLQMLPKLKVFVWGFSSVDILNFPKGSLVENITLSEEYFEFVWPEEALNGNNPWNHKPRVRINVYQVEGNVDLGFSGAPVCYEGDKKVIGIFTARNNKRGYVIPIETLLAKFRDNN